MDVNICRICGFTRKMKNCIVIITTLDASITAQIINQLMDLGINRFDHISNWLLYEKEDKE